MLACVACNMLWMNNWLVQILCALDSHRTAIKTSQLVPPKNVLLFQNTDSRFSQNNSFHHNSICCKHRHRLVRWVLNKQDEGLLRKSNIGIDVIIIGIAQQCWFHAWLIISSNQLVCRSSLFTKGKKQTKKGNHSFAF